MLSWPQNSLTLQETIYSYQDNPASVSLDVEHSQIIEKGVEGSLRASIEAELKATYTTDKTAIEAVYKQTILNDRDFGRPAHLAQVNRCPLSIHRPIPARRPQPPAGGRQFTGQRLRTIAIVSDG